MRFGKRKRLVYATRKKKAQGIRHKTSFENSSLKKEKEKKGHYVQSIQFFVLSSMRYRGGLSKRKKKVKRIA